MDLLFEGSAAAAGALWLRFFIALRMAPLMGDKPLPIPAVGGLSAVVTLFLLPGLPWGAPGTLSFSGMFVLLLNEVAAGVLLGLSIRFSWLVIAVSGGITNKTAVSVMPDRHDTLYGRLYLYLGAAVFLLIDGHHSFFLAGMRALEAMPPMTTRATGVLWVGDSGVFPWLLSTFAAAFQFGVLVSAPIWVTALAVELLLAYGARLFQLDRTPMFLSVRTILVQMAVIAFLWKTITILAQFPLTRMADAWH